MGERFDTVAALAQCDAAEERAAKATPGPWRVGTVEKWHIYAPYPESIAGPGGERVVLRFNEYFDYAAEAAFIAAARADVPELAAHLRAAVAEINRLRAAAVNLLECAPACEGGFPCYRCEWCRASAKLEQAVRS